MAASEQNSVDALDSEMTKLRIDLARGGTMDFKKLQDVFKEFCTDFGEPLTTGGKFSSIEFCFKVLTKIGPIAKLKSDRIFTFQFRDSGVNDTRQEEANTERDTSSAEVSKMEPETTNTIRTVFVGTFGSKEPPYQYRSTSDQLYLTFDQAMLLAMVTYEEMSLLAAKNEPPKFLLTPLAEALYNSWGCECMAAIFEKQQVDIHAIVNASTLRNGQYLPSSSFSCALSCLIVTSSKAKHRESLIQRVAREYTQAGKQFNEFEFIIYRYFAKRRSMVMGVKEMMEQFDKIQELKRTGPSPEEEKEFWKNNGITKFPDNLLDKIKSGEDVDIEKFAREALGSKVTEILDEVRAFGLSSSLFSTQ